VANLPQVSAIQVDNLNPKKGVKTDVKDTWENLLLVSTTPMINFGGAP
jgi:hypothetical protein